MLRLAVRRLAEDRDLRATLGAAARRHWQAQGTPELMARDYEELLEAARVAADPVVPEGWPDHLRADGTATARRLVAGMGVPFPCDPPAAGRL